MITENSRYRQAVITTEVGPDGETRQEMRAPFPRSRQITFTYYRVLSGDRVDTIAYRFFGNGQLWWMIADANPEVLDWTDLQPGLILRVPNA